MERSRKGECYKRQWKKGTLGIEQTTNKKGGRRKEALEAFDEAGVVVRPCKEREHPYKKGGSVLD